MPHDSTREILKEVRALLAPLRRYKVEAVLGSGAMGSVLLVRHDVLGLRALKLINPNYLNSNTLRRRFFNEAKVMARLRGKHLVEVYEVDEVEKRFLDEVGDLPPERRFPYIVMEYLQGGTLFDHLVEFGAMPPRQAIQVTIAILEALEAAHTHCDEEGNPSPIIHRDVKAENVLLTKNGTPKLGDFGIAHMESGTKQLTRDVETLGTFAYMAPEQRDGARSVDGRADIYAVGVTLYVMLKCPDRMWVDVFHAILARNPEMMDGVPEELQVIIRRATQERREDRYENAQAMASALRETFASLPENPEETPKLGTAPQVERDREAQELAQQHGSSVPAYDGENSVMAPRHGMSSGEGLSSHGEQSQPRHAPPLGIAISSKAEAVANPWGGSLHGGEGGGTQSGTQFERELDVTRDAAKRRFFMGVAGAVVMLVITGAGIWFMTNTKKQVEAMPSIVQAQPITEIQSPAQVTAIPAQTSPEVVEPVQAPVVVAPQIKTEKKVAKAATPAVIKAPAEETPAPEKAQVRLILKEETVASVVLVGEAGTFTVSPSDTVVTLPVGAYKASVQMDGRDGAPQTGTLTVTQGVTTITCIVRYKKCTGLK